HCWFLPGLFTSSPWRLAALTLLTLCLALMVGLLALVVVSLVFSTSQCGIKTRMMIVLFPPEMSCTLCPPNWQRMGDDTCYYISSGKKTWEGSRNFCASQNSTLLMIKDKQKLVCSPAKPKRYWIGLSQNKTERDGWFWEDTTALSTSEKRISVYSAWYPCAFLLESYIYADQSCNQNNFWICEKAPIHLRLTDNQ
uniref:Natural killer cells antigen CD94 n=1 Tax=Gopherus agassizii TaxID=38772 RepID=A0A452HSX4_9SAUR